MNCGQRRLSPHLLAAIIQLSVLPCSSQLVPMLLALCLPLHLENTQHLHHHPARISALPALAPRAFSSLTAISRSPFLARARPVCISLAALDPVELAEVHIA